jgi:hypothetical protein
VKIFPRQEVLDNKLGKDIYNGPKTSATSRKTTPAALFSLNVCSLIQQGWPDAVSW